MSQWTHVAGLIRIDSLQVAMGMMTSTNFGFHISDAIAPPPMGSEGPVQFEVRKYPGTEEYGRSLFWGYVSIWGDLRDFGDDDDIEKLRSWVADIMKCFGRRAIAVRDFVLSAQVEYSDTHIMMWDEENKKIVTLISPQTKWQADE